MTPEQYEEGLQALFDVINETATDYSAGFRTYTIDDPIQQMLHEGCLELEQRGKIVRHKEEGEMIVWKPAPLDAQARITELDAEVKHLRSGRGGEMSIKTNAENAIAAYDGGYQSAFKKWQQELDQANAQLKTTADYLLKCEIQLDQANARIAELQEEIKILRAECDGETAAFDYMARQNEQLKAEIQQLRTALEKARNDTQPAEQQGEPAPIDVLLFCPHCGKQHVDEPQPEKGWDNPPHRSHLCAFCRWVWRPADVPTNGVAKIKTKGQRDKDPQPVEVVKWHWNDNE
jgi:regulator of replication initiation timing